MQLALVALMQIALIRWVGFDARWRGGNACLALGMMSLKLPIVPALARCCFLFLNSFW